MPTSRRTATNENIQTFGAAGQGRDFTSLSTWESATDINLVSAAQSEVLECFDDQASFDQTVSLEGATTNSSFFRIIRAASGEGHDGTSNNGFTISSTAETANMSIGESFSQLQDIILSKTADSALTRFIISLGGIDSKVIGCIAFDGVNNGSGNVRAYRAVSNNNLLVLCLADNNEETGFFANAGSGETIRFYNCTAVNNGDSGFGAVGSGTQVAINCLSDNNTADFSSGLDSPSDFNASGDGTATVGASSRINQTFTFVNAGGNDFHLDDADAGADNFGTDLSGDSVFDFDDDIDVDLFDTWDIGFDENSPPSGDLSINVNDCTPIKESLT